MIPENMNEGVVVGLGPKIYIAWKYFEDLGWIWSIFEFNGKKWALL